MFSYFKCPLFFLLIFPIVSTDFVKQISNIFEQKFDTTDYFTNPTSDLFDITSTEATSYPSPITTTFPDTTSYPSTTTTTTFPATTSYPSTITPLITESISSKNLYFLEILNKAKHLNLKTKKPPYILFQVAVFV